MNEKTLESFFSLLDECGEEHGDRHGVFITYKNYWRLAARFQAWLADFERKEPVVDYPNRILSGKQVREMTGIGKTTMEALVAKGDFPASFSVSSLLRNPGWRMSDVLSWMEDPETWAASNAIADMMTEEEDG